MKDRRSLLDRSGIRLALVPKTEEKKKVSFSPTGYYDDETDVTAIHEYVLNHFKQKQNEIPRIDTQISEIKRRLSRERLKIIEEKELKSKIKELEREKELLLSDDKYKEYLERISPVLSEWNSIRESEGPYVKFGENKKFSLDKLTLVRSFIQIASEYAPLNLIIKPVNQRGVCPYCRNQLNDEEEGKIICYECGIYQDSLTNDVTFSDLSRINGANSNNYVNRETFVKAMANYQGKGNPDFPDDIMERIDEYCEQNRINKYKLDPVMTREIFKRTGFSAYYDHINLFLFKYIKRPLPDISQYEHLLLQDYDLFSQEYQLVKGDDRDSSLNAQYVLYILMRRRKIPCNIVDFKLPDTKSIRLEIDCIARRAFASLEAKRKGQGLPWIFEDTI